jgi:hypothetical protein
MTLLVSSGESVSFLWGNYQYSRTIMQEVLSPLTRAVLINGEYSQLLLGCGEA